MLGNVNVVNSNMPSDLRKEAETVCRYFEEEVEVEVRKRSLIRAIFPALFPCHILGLVDKQNIHIVFTNINAGQMPSQNWEDKHNLRSFSSEEVVRAAVQELGFINPSTFLIPLDVLKRSEEEQRSFLRGLAVAYVGDTVRLAKRPQTISGYEGLQPYLDAFSVDHPQFDSNVFIAMRFRADKQFIEIHASIKSRLAQYGLKGLRSDDKIYLPDGDLWSNICVYMMGCKLGVCVFEEIDEREFNPNVPLEYGFLRAINRQVLLLKDRRMPKLPSDMTGKLYRHFDTYDITESIHEQISQWAERDLGLKLIL